MLAINVCKVYQCPCAVTDTTVIIVVFLVIAVLFGMILTILLRKGERIVETSKFKASKK